MATLENRSFAPSTKEKKTRFTARRTPLVISAFTAALVVPALVATVAVANIGHTSSLTEATASVASDSAVATTAVATTETTSSAITATTVSAKKKTTYEYSLAKVVKVAERYKGTSYRYGGASPAGFDCSGFTKYVYSKFGITLPHSAAAQGKLGDRVSKAKAKPGDIVVTSGGSHVGIYVGKGKFIDAPMPGQTVHIRKIYTSNYYVVHVDKDTHNV